MDHLSLFKLGSGPPQDQGVHVGVPLAVLTLGDDSVPVSVGSLERDHVNSTHCWNGLQLQ